MVQKQALALDLFLNEAHQSIFGDRSGDPADYIPELANVPPELTAGAIMMADGHRFVSGDAVDYVFSLQSVAKLVVLAGLLMVSRRPLEASRCPKQCRKRPKTYLLDPRGPGAKLRTPGGGTEGRST